MPAKSKAQFRLMQAARRGKSRIKISRRDAAEFVEGVDPDVLPEKIGRHDKRHKKAPRKRGGAIRDHILRGRRKTKKA